jgi:hypothetical protein
MPRTEEDRPDAPSESPQPTSPTEDDAEFGAGAADAFASGDEEAATTPDRG